MKIIAIDAGGTSTKFALYGPDERPLDELKLSTCHILQVGPEKMIEILKEGIEELAKRNKLDDYYLSFGMAGYGRDEKIKKTIEEAIDKNFDKYVLANDVEIALKAAFPQEDGIILIAGTGSIAYRKTDQGYIRSGGWGYKIGDEGSGYWIGRKALEYFTKQADKRLEKTELYQALKDYYGLENDFDLISVSANLDRKETAELSRLVAQLAQAGDKACMEILDQASWELSLLVKALAHADKPNRLALIGGAFNSGDLFIDLLSKHLGPNFQVAKSKNPPEYGAYLLAKEKFYD